MMTRKTKIWLWVTEALRAIRGNPRSNPRRPEIRRIRANVEHRGGSWVVTQILPAGHWLTLM